MSQLQVEKRQHIISKQRDMESGLQEDLKSKKFTFDAPKVVVNPYHISPLTALVMFTTDEPVSVEITVKGHDAANDVKHTFPEATDHALPIYGLYYLEKTPVQLKLSSGEERTLEIETEKDDRESLFPNVLNIVNEDNHLEDKWMFVTPTSRHYGVAVDNAGDIRWYLNTNITFDIKRLQNGRILIGTDRLVLAPYYVSGLYEMDLSGKIYKEYRIPGGYHHDTQELSNGDIIALSGEPNAETVEDTMVQIDRETGEIKRVWDFKDMFEGIDHVGSGSYSEEDWAHANSVAYDEDRDEVFISSRHLDLIFVFSFDTGELKFIIGDPEGWDKEVVEKYFFTTDDEDLEWNYEQHGLSLTPKGNLFYFDNGHYRSKNPDEYLKNADNYSRGVLYEIDRENRKVKQLYQYGKERGAEFFSPYISNAVYYDEGNYLVHSGGIAYKKGEAYEGVASMEPYNDKIDLRSITVELVDEQVKFELEFDANMYRARKMTPYYKGEVSTLGRPGQIVGDMSVSDEMDATVPTLETKTEIPDRYKAELVEEIDRFIFSATYETGELAMLMLDQGDDRKQYFISTGANSAQAMCVGTFLKEDSKERDLYLNKNALSGEYKVHFYVDGTLYETGLTIEV